jgi:hypothetical protein
MSMRAGCVPFLLALVAMNCKLQKSRLRGSDGAVDFRVPLPQKVVGGFVVPFKDKETQNKIFPIHFTFVLRFQNEGKQALFSSCADSEGGYRNMPTDDSNIVLKAVGLEMENEPGEPNLPSAPSQDRKTQEGKTQEGKARGEPSPCVQDMFPLQNLKKEEASFKLAEEAGNDTSAKNPTGSLEGSLMPDNLLVLKGADPAGETPIEVTLRANSLGWQVEELTYAGTKSWIEHSSAE